MRMKDRGLLLIVSGPSGAGKGTICREILKQNKNIYYSISDTTRPPRPEETGGESYNFLSEAEFLKKTREGRFLEWAYFCGNYYGTPLDTTMQKLDEGFDVILEIEVQGAAQVQEKFPEGVYIFVLPPSMAELKKRLINRSTEPPETIEARLKTAAWEFSHIEKYDYILLNDDIGAAVKRFEAIIKAEGARVCRNKKFIRQVCDS